MVREPDNVEVRQKQLQDSQERLRPLPRTQDPIESTHLPSENIRLASPAPGIDQKQPPYQEAWKTYVLAFSEMPSLLLAMQVPSAILKAVYIPPCVEVKSSLDEIYTATNALEVEYHEAVFIISRDFNQAKLKRVIPKYHQQVSYPARGPDILDHCYTIIKDAYSSIPCLHFGKSDHDAVFLLLAYKQKLKHEDSVQKVLHCWSMAVKELLWVCLKSVDWSMLKNSPANPDEYARVITNFISKCVEDCVPKKSIRMYPNWKPWMNQEIHCLLKIRNAVFKSDNLNIYRKSRYDFQKAIRDAKRQYWTNKPKELIISIRKQGGGHAPIYINGAEVEIDKSIKFLG
eukprot:g41868.t1